MTGDARLVSLTYIGSSLKAKRLRFTSLLSELGSELFSIFLILLFPRCGAAAFSLSSTPPFTFSSAARKDASERIRLYDAYCIRSAEGKGKEERIVRLRCVTPSPLFSGKFRLIKLHHGTSRRSTRVIRFDTHNVTIISD